MTDGEMRGLVLQKFYDLRNEDRRVQLPALESIAPDNIDQLLNVCEQLSQHGLLDWETSRAIGMGGDVGGIGKITASGVDVIEGTARPPLTITVHDQSVSVSGSNNVQIGNANTLIANVDIRRVHSEIDKTNASPTEKDEAKSLWGKLLNNATFAAVFAALVTAATSAK
jgi:RIP homotypic interaction motif